MEILGHCKVIVHGKATTQSHCEKCGSVLPGDTPKIECDLGWISSPSDWRFLKEWQQLVKSSPAPKEDHIDSAEYAALAAERWKYMNKRNECALSLKNARIRVEQHPKSEFGFCIALLMPDGKKSRVIGFAYVRRLWSGNLFLEFLGKIAPPKTGAVGTHLLNALAHYGKTIKSPEIWGECTETSKPFYRKTKTDLLMASLESSKNDGFSVQGWQMPGEIEDRFIFGLDELKVMSVLPPFGEFDEGVGAV